MRSDEKIVKGDVSSPWCFSEGHKGAGMTLAVARKHGKPPGLQWCHAGENSRFCSWWSGTSTAGCYHDATKSWIIQTRAVGTDDTVMGRVGAPYLIFLDVYFGRDFIRSKESCFMGLDFMQLVEEICEGSCFVWQRQVDVTRIVGDNHRLRPEKLGLH